MVLSIWTSWILQLRILSTTKAFQQMIQSVMSSVKLVCECVACMFQRQQHLTNPSTVTNDKKLPRWHPRSNKCIYMGLNHTYSTIAPLLLDTSPVSILPKFHITFNDWFFTVTSSTDSLPSFISDE